MAVHLHKAGSAESPVAQGALLRIGLVNNMPDAALRATERQFTALLRHASEGLDVSLSFFALPAVPRGTLVQSHIAAAYSPLAALELASLDALIITGAEPIKPRLVEEPYWTELTHILDWAGGHTLSTVCSCLAAHAAVLHMDGIERVRRKEKYFGVFECRPDPSHFLLGGLPRPFCTPHSRWNGLREGELDASGYQVLSRTADGGVDFFVRQQRKSLFVFFQGHPEYSADTLLREFRRDVARFCHGERPTLPLLPESYFAQDTAAALNDLWRSAGVLEAEHLLSECTAILHSAHPAHAWQSHAVGIYRNWLRHLKMEKDGALPFPLLGGLETAPEQVL